jgi:hypothetical protein
VSLTCPPSSNFVDAFGGLYGPDGSYPVSSASCIGDATGQNTSVSVSSLQFQCNSCPVGRYSMYAGSSNGTAGQANNATCLACPRGAQCSDTGTVHATQDHWGDSDSAGVVSLVLCPAGYCKSAVIAESSGSVNLSRNAGKFSSAVPPSVVQNACAGQRTGPLCSDCSPGFVDALGSTGCAAVAACAKDKAEVWPLIALALLGSAVVQLVFVSAVWSTTRKPPSATVKLAMYFFQVRRL